MPESPRRRPSMEALEVRHLPATFGLPWPDPQHLTLSFMPDGTPLGGGVTSIHGQSLNARMPTSAWQLDVLRAFQSWAALGNINIALVADNGQGPGQPGPPAGFGGLDHTGRHDHLCTERPADLATPRRRGQRDAEL